MKRDALLVLIGGFSIHLFNGCFFLWGNMAPYVLSYFYYFGTDTKIKLSDAVVITPLLCLGLMVMNPLVASWQVNPKIPLTIGSSVAIIGLLLSTKVPTFSMFLLTFPIVLGVGIGFCYFPPLQCGWEWVPQKGLVTGVILGAFGFGSFLFSFLA